MSGGIISSIWAGLGYDTSKQQTPGTHADDHAETEAKTDDGGDTPKAEPTAQDTSVPTFSLISDDPTSDTEPVDSSSNIRPTSNSSPNGTLSVGSMPPPPLPKSSSLSPNPMQSSLRIPSSGPLPNRGPPSNSQQRAGTSGARGKVLLAPGHSPMDWAALTKKSNLSGVSGFKRITASEMKAMNGRKGKPIWSSWQGKVYNMTPYMPFHPGGEKELLKAAGRDATKLFMEIHPWVNWDGMLSACLVGVLVSDEQQESSLESLD